MYTLWLEHFIIKNMVTNFNKPTKHKKKQSKYPVGTSLTLRECEYINEY